MKDLISTAIAIIYSSGLLFGTGYTLKSIHDEVKKSALIKVSQGLESSELLSNSLTGEKTDF
ncbi:MAG: hypothetical protein ACRBBP_10485 [Bdellovibrionales bacterium]